MTFKKGISGMLGRKHSQETKDKIGKANKGKKHTPEFCQFISSMNKGKSYTKGKHWKLSLETIEKLRKAKSLMTEETKRKIGDARRGEKNYNWIKDRSKLKRFNDDQKDRRSSAYNTWRKEVWSRDNFKCKLNNNSCLGRLEAHHILGYTDHPELRYDINNGITLCHAHHPRKRAEEKQLIPTFKELVPVSKE